MADFRRESLHQAQVVTLTAFDQNDKLALEPMRQQTERLFEGGVRVFIPCAGSSEFHAMDNEEIVASIEMTRQVVGDEAHIICPVGLQLKNAIDLGQRALTAGADGVLVMPLGHPYQSDSGARDYYTTLLDELACPSIIYKKTPIPSNNLLLELASHPHLVGIKYSLTDISGYQNVVAADEGRLDWFCGLAERYAPFYALAGAPGYTSGAGNICPRVTVAMHAALARSDWEEALRLQQIIMPIETYRARADNSYNISFLKHAIKSLGFDFGAPRPPYRQLTKEEMLEIDEMIAPIVAAEEELAATVVS